MSKFLRSLFMGMLLCSTGVLAQQLPDPHFEDWSGSDFNGNIQPKYWHGSNVEQAGFKFNFTYREAGRTGYSVMVKDQEVGAMGITEVGPGYFSLGTAWQYLSGLNTGSATAGTVGGISFTYRPDSVSVWVRRTGDRTADEDFHILFYSWVGETRGDKYRNKSGDCQGTTRYDEESDIRQALDGNDCGTAVKGTQVAEGWLYDRKYYGEWTNIKVPIFYMNNTVPEKCNMLFSASNYPNFRANSGLYAGNALYVDDVELIYSSKIHTLYVGGKEWKGFDPNSTDVQVYSLGESATAVPDIEAMRGAGTLTNSKGTTVTFPGRTLTSKEISIEKGDLVSKPTKITVKAEDGSSTTVYQIQFQKAASSNAKLANIQVNGATIAGFSPTKYNYTVDLPYGTTAAPVVTAEGQEDAQTIAITQASSPTGTAKIVVTAANKTATASYSIEFRVAALSDNTLKDIKVNGKSVPGFTPSQTIYKVSLPENTTSMPTVEAVSAYPSGAQTITKTPPATIDGGQYQISVTTPGNPVAKVYKLNFKLEKSSYTYLQDLKVGGVSVEGFEPTKLTYSVSLPMGTTELPAITWTQGDEFQKVEMSSLGAGVVDGTVTITVTAGNGDQSRYRIIFSTEKSSVSTLNMIYLDGQPLEGFSADKKEYAVSLPIGTTELPTITWDKGDEYQSVVPTPGGLNGKTRITVTAGDGSTTVYTITFSVQLATNATLNSIKVDGVEIEGFDPEVFEYSYSLPMGTTTMPEVTYEKHDDFQTITVRNGGINGDYKITVRPQSGNSNTYIIHFSVATSSNTSLSMIYLDGTPLENFDPENTEYEINLPEGVSKIPAVTFDKGESSQRVLSVLENKVQTITVTAESGAKRIYTITFNVVVSENAFLNMIYLDGDSLEGFVSDKLDYTQPLNTTTCPVITVDKAAGQQVTITAPYAAGEATILVQPESGTPNTYTIKFEAAAPITVRLADILIDGVSLPNFSATTSHYELNYEKSLPEVQGVAENADQTISVLWKGEEARIQVSDKAGNKAAYTVAFTRQVSSNARLQAILIDGIPWPTFQPTEFTYDIDLPAGSTYPEVGYQASEETQVVFFGQVADGKWAISVMAEDNTKQTYTVQFHLAKYEDATLENLTVSGFAIPFAPDNYFYELTIAEGDTLPDVAVVAKKGQTVLQFNANENEQHIIVTAESGATNTYIIAYTRAKSADALLANILIDGQSIEGFDPETFDYIDTLAWRSKVVPNVFPIARNINQIITTTYSRPNGITRIHVEAQDGTEADYSIAFPVRKSSNVELSELYLNSEDVEINFKPNVTDYTVEMPYQATACPPVAYEAAEPEQRIDVISRPLGDTTKIIVVAENGDTRTYNIYFKETLAEEANRLSMIRVRIDNNEELEQELSLKDKTKRDFEVTVPFGSRAFTVEYEKMYPEQTVFVQPGGVHHPTILTVKANRPGEADEVYTITPDMPTADPAVLTDLKINGTTIEGFASEQFSYVVPVTSKPIVRYTLNKGAEINVLEQTTKHWKAEITYGTRTNIYDVWYYYPNDVVPNSDFSEWVEMDVYKGDPKSGAIDLYYDDREPIKPKGWNTIGDALDKDVWMGTMYFYPTELIARINTNQVQLTSVYGNGLGGTVPAFITLGKVTGSYGRFGATSFDIGSGISFHNSPDQMILTYNSSEIYDHNLIQYTLFGLDGDTTLTWSDTETSSSLKTVTFDLSAANKAAGAPTTMNIVLCAAHQIGGFNMNHHTTMVIDNIQMTFNHTLASLQVDTFLAAQTDNSFAVTLADPERIEKPILTFTGEVNDQVQLVTWDPAETLDGEYAVRNATIRNFAENGTDYTDYTLSVRRPLEKKNQLSALIIDGDTLNTFLPTKTDYTLHMAPSRRNMHDIVPVPASSLQTITTSFADSTMTITVTPEYGEATVYTIRFVTDLSDDTTLAALTAEGITYDPATTAYEVKADYLPLITFTKQSDRQVVSLQNGVLTVTAENGGVGTYTITRQDPTYSTNGVIAEFTENGNIITGFGGTSYTRQEEKPANAIAFAREAEVDSVIFIQTKDSMTWHAIGTNEKHAYKWEYPVELSSNTKLRMIRVDGVDYTSFDPNENTYVIQADTIKQVETVADEGQTIQVSQSSVTGGFAYAVKVKAQNGDEQTYSVSVQKPLSSIATLNGILLDSVLIPNFDPDTTTYLVTLPAPAVKTTEPKMPSVTYVAGQAGQTVDEIEPAGLGEQVIITVHSEDGSDTKDYYLTVVAAPSACKDLTGIIVNGEAIDQFETGRHYYSVTLKSNTINVDYTSDDRFQTVKTLVDTIKPDQQYNYILRVFAENGDSTQYEVMTYVENRSSDIQLANITLDGKNFTDFERALNPDLTFDPGNNNYRINLPAGTTILPEVSAQLKVEGQTVVIDNSKQDSILLHVTAADHVSTNTYTLHFIVPLSTNANLSMIYLNGDSLKDFMPDYYFYQIELPVGVHTLPEVVGQKGEASQTMTPADIDPKTNRATITVTAENPTFSNKYVISFHFNQSDADTLAMLYADGDTLTGFKPTTFRYSLELPVGTDAFPDISWDEADEWQTITMDTTDLVDQQFIRREVTVIAESGLKNIYTVSHTILKSTVDTLRTIFVNNVAIPNFKADSTEYYCQLTISQAAELNGAMPLVTWTEGDEYQEVDTISVPDPNADKMKCLPFKKIVTVTADAGNKRVYTIHYPIELSSEKLLDMIYVAGDSLPNFDKENPSYTLLIEQTASVPVVTWTKGEDIQTVELTTGKDTVRLHVTAENGEQMLYTLAFERKKSDVKLLRDIILTDAEGQTLSTGLFAFRPEIPEYDIAMPYDPTGANLLPTIEYQLYDTLQTVTRQDHDLPNGDIKVSLLVLAPNEEDESEYSLTFHFTRNNDARVLDIAFNGVTLKDFDVDKTEYEYRLPYGSDESAFVTLDQVSYILSDSLAADTCFIDDEKTIFIRVMAQDGINEMTYIIRQYVGLDDDCSLASIELDGMEIEDFDSEVFFYTYLLLDGQNPPMVTATPNSENADVSIRAVSAGDTCTILCTAMDGTEKRYYVHFAISTINTDATATAGSVLMKRVPGEAKIFVATIRKDVTFFLFDQNGRLLFSNPVPVADPNDVDMYIDLNGQEVLNDVSTTGMEVEINIGQIYFYAFRSSEKVIHSGKFIGLP
ncbi:MAG: hypothetical protein IJS82_00395 [Paludibacteraceae bacterium]|nr:hypothetical protein [Paludibacteraceae bacterium]